VGRGGNPAHFAGFGVPMAESRARFEEALDYVRLAWSEERFSFRGRFFQAADLALAPRPVQRPHPPVRVAANGAETAEWAGRAGLPILVASNVNPFRARAARARRRWGRRCGRRRCGAARHRRRTAPGAGRQRAPSQLAPLPGTGLRIAGGTVRSETEVAAGAATRAAGAAIVRSKSRPVVSEFTAPRRGPNRAGLPAPARRTYWRRPAPGRRRTHPPFPFSEPACPPPPAARPRTAPPRPPGARAARPDGGGATPCGTRRRGAGGAAGASRPRRRARSARRSRARGGLLTLVRVPTLATSPCWTPCTAQHLPTVPYAPLPPTLAARTRRRSRP
jgi:hypothetical protein